MNTLNVNEETNKNALTKEYTYKYEWVVKYWRPMMAWQYFVICLFDFLIFPLVIMLFNNSDKFIKWVPLTLEGGGLYHLSMGMIIGVTAWTRGQEKMRYMHNNYYGNFHSSNPYFGSEREREFSMGTTEDNIPRVRRQPI